jgi:hypothetical protein
VIRNKIVNVRAANLTLSHNSLDIHSLRCKETEMININKHYRLYLEVIAIMIITLAACDGASTSSNYGSESNADLLKMGINNMKNALSYHLDVDSNTDSRVTKITGDIDVTNKNSKLDLNEGGLTRTYISIGSDNYISTDGGKSFSKGLQSLTGTVNQFEGIWSKVDTIEMDKNKDALKDGVPATEIVDGISCKHITIAAKDLSSLNLGASLDGTYDIWVAGDGSSVKQMKAVGNISGENLTLIATWSNINGEMSITAPPNNN